MLQAVQVVDISLTPRVESARVLSIFLFVKKYSVLFFKKPLGFKVGLNLCTPYSAGRGMERSLGELFTRFDTDGSGYIRAC